MYTAAIQKCTYMHIHAYTRMSDLLLRQKQKLCYNSNLSNNTHVPTLYFSEEFLISVSYFNISFEMS